MASKWARHNGPGRPATGSVLVRHRKPDLIVREGPGLCPFTTRPEQGVFPWPSNVDPALAMAAAGVIEAPSPTPLIERTMLGVHPTGWQGQLPPTQTRLWQSVFGAKALFFRNWQDIH